MARPGGLFLWVAFVAMITGWVFTLGGLSAVTDTKMKYCDDLKTGFPDDQDLAAVLYFQCKRNVDELSNFYWFVWASEILAIGGVLLSLVGGHSMWSRLRFGLAGLLCIIATLSIIQTNTLFTLIRSQLTDGDEETNLPGTQLLRTKITLSGFVISAIANVLLVFLLGMPDNEAQSLSHDYPEKI